MKPPPRNLKRKRSSLLDDPGDNKTIKSPSIEIERSPVEILLKRPSPPRDTTSETSGLTSADEVVTVTSATGVESDDSKHASESGHLPVEGNQITEIITAYRNAMEILVEVANRDRYRTYHAPYMGFGGPVYNTPYAIGAPGHPTTPAYVNPPMTAYTTPYANSGGPSYVTPYSNPLVVSEASESSLNDTINGRRKTSSSSQEQDVHHALRKDTVGDKLTPHSGDYDIGELTEAPNGDEAESMPLGLLDGFLALANGGVLPGQDGDVNDQDEHEDARESMLFAPPSPNDTIDESLSRLDEDIQAIVGAIAQDLISTEELPTQVPPANPYAAFCSSMNGKQLGAELKRLVAVVQPEINAIMSRAQIQAAHLFYTHLVGCAHTRNTRIMRLAQASIHGPHIPMNQWGPAAFPPPPRPPKGYMVMPAHFAPNFMTPSPSQHPSFVPRGNVIAPPVVRDLEEERKIAVFGFPPVPGAHSGDPTAVKKGKRKQRS